MDIDELIARLQLLKQQHAGIEDLPIFYEGIRSPVNGVVVLQVSIGRCIFLTADSVELPQ